MNGRTTENWTSPGTSDNAWATHHIVLHVNVGGQRLHVTTRVESHIRKPESHTSNRVAKCPGRYGFRRGNKYKLWPGQEKAVRRYVSRQ